MHAFLASTRIERAKRMLDSVCVGSALQRSVLIGASHAERAANLFSVWVGSVLQVQQPLCCDRLMQNGFAHPRGRMRFFVL
jgi:hypothetical protein